MTAPTAEQVADYERTHDRLTRLIEDMVNDTPCACGDPLPSRWRNRHHMASYYDWLDEMRALDAVSTPSHNRRA